MVFQNTKKFRIASQIAAEADGFLFTCFHDNGTIEELIDNRFEIIAGRKGTGKTAIARYLQQKHEEYGVDYATRLTLSDLQGFEGNSDGKIDVENLLRYLIVTTSQKLLEHGDFTTKGIEYWKGYMSHYGLQDVSSFKEWMVNAKQRLTKKSAGLGIKVANAGVEQDDSQDFERQTYPESPTALLDRLSESIAPSKKVIIFVDDITDYLEHPQSESIKQSLQQVAYVLHQLNNYNTKLNDNGVDLLYVTTVRGDLWEYISGANENKLKHNCLWLNWDEADFCKLLIKRLPHFSDRIEEALENPEKSIQEVFPDSIFDDVMRNKGLKPQDVKQHHTKFYSYVQLITFNRPRDFLRLCHALKTRLSQQKPVEAMHVHAAEREYSTYFYDEVKDELGIFAGALNLDVHRLLDLLDDLAVKSKLSYSEVRTIVGKTIKASHRNTNDFLKSLWMYSLLGVLGINGYAEFKHDQSKDKDNELKFPREDAIKQSYFMLHRGIYWKLKS